MCFIVNLEAPKLKKTFVGFNNKLRCYSFMKLKLSMCSLHIIFLAVAFLVNYHNRVKLRESTNGLMLQSGSKAYVTKLN